MSIALLHTQSDPSVEPEKFRAAMRSLAGAVSIITAGAGHARNGLTVTSASSFSVGPASIVTSINLTASAWPLVRREGRFSVQVLAEHQSEIAADFSGRTGLKGAERYRHGNWTTFASGTPLLQGALISLDCEIDAVYERHSHALVVGLVKAASVSAGSPLAYYSGGFARIREMP